MSSFLLLVAMVAVQVQSSPNTIMQSPPNDRQQEMKRIDCLILPGFQADALAVRLRWTISCIPFGGRLRSNVKSGAVTLVMEETRLQVPVPKKGEEQARPAIRPNPSPSLHCTVQQTELQKVQNDILWSIVNSLSLFRSENYDLMLRRCF